MAIQQQRTEESGWSWRTPPAGGWERIRAGMDKSAETAGSRALAWCAASMVLVAPLLAWQAVKAPDISAGIVQQAQLLESSRQAWVALDAADPDASVQFYLALPVAEEKVSAER